MLIPVTLVGVTFLVFCLTRLVPGGPVERILQEQAIGALAGDKAVGGAENAIGDDEVERLEEMFNLDEPMLTGYLQWLGVLPRKVQVSKAELGDDGCAQLSVVRADGRAAVVPVRLEGESVCADAPDWWAAEGWLLEAQSPHARALRWAERHHVEDPAAIARQEASPALRRWRAVAHRKVFDGVLQGNLGRSYKYNEPVAAMMLDRLPATLYLGLLGALITYLVSIPLGVVKAIRHRGVFDSLSSILIFTGYAVPGFALGAVLLVYLGARLEWFPLYGLTSPGFEALPPWGQARDLLAHTVLPLLCYVVSTFAMTTMMMKNNLMDNLSADYVRTAVAKGLSFKRAVWRHAFRNSFIPIASTLGSVVCTVVGGSLLIERVFDIQGFGMLSFQALMDKDYSLIMGTLLLTSGIIIIGNLLSDLLVASIDPRVKFE
ncbi:MAG: ABC transporter permease [Akkermansia sp.]|nr:ABC transporter permease [Akkermansia sp.]